MNEDGLREKEEMYSENREHGDYMGERSLDLYLKEINNTPLLTREQEPLYLQAGTASPGDFPASYAPQFHRASHSS